MIISVYKVECDFAECEEYLTGFPTVAVTKNSASAEGWLITEKYEFCPRHAHAIRNIANTLVLQGEGETHTAKAYKSTSPGVV